MRAAVLILAATAVPVAGLFWASAVARNEFQHRALSALEATGKATVLQERQAWDDASRVVSAAALRATLVGGLQSHNAEVVQQGAQNALITGPFAGVRIYDAIGNLVARAAVPGVTPTAVDLADPRPVGDPVTDGGTTLRQIRAGIAAPSGGPALGRLIVDVDVTQLLGKPADLAFGHTGTKSLVTPAGMVVAGSAAVGTPLRSPANLAIAAAGKPVTAIVYSPFYQRMTVEAYEPVPAQDMGILVQQARSEVMGGGDHLAGLLRWVATGIGVLGLALAALLGILQNRRSRRLDASERRVLTNETQSRRRLEQFLDAMPIGVFVATPDGHPYYANREAERLLGRGVHPGAGPDELAEVYGAYLSGTDDPYPAAEMPLVRALSREASHADNMEIRRPDATVPIEIWGTPILTGDNNVEFAITAFADVSERRRIAEEVQLLSVITANMSEGVVVVRAVDAAMTYANRSLEAMFGYDAGELVGRSFHELTAGHATPEAAASSMMTALHSHGAWRGDVKTVRKDGAAFWCNVNVTSLDHATSGPFWIAVLTDITARKEAQEAQARLASLVQASREAILGKTLEGIVTSWNPGAQALFGYTADEIIGVSIDVLVPPEGRDEEAHARGQVARGFAVEPYDTVRLRKDGTPVDVSVTLSPIQDAEGRTTGIATICHDISERRRGEAALREREEQLAAARDQALEASRLKSQFVANMSHEIRTPMNGVLGMAQLLLNGNLEPGQRRRVLNLLESGESLLTIINDILDFSKMEAGKLELEQEDFDLVAAAEGVVSLLSSPANDKGLNLTVDVAEGVPRWVTGDSGRLRQILINLLGNAVKFTERGSVGFRISRGSSGKLRFAIADTGIGIDLAEKARLLEPFSQADASTTRRFGGTGLGLAICHQLVDLMGGSLDYTSELGLGTTFFFEIDLPAAAAGAPDEAAKPDEEVELAPGPAAGRPAGETPEDGNGRILLVDDYSMNREVGKELLEHLGFPVDTVASGVEAVEAVRRVTYTAVLMDCLMPVMDGYEATRAIRAFEGPSAHVPIVAVTAAAMSGDRERCLAAGMDDYVSKPLNLDLLAAALDRCTRGQGSPPVATGSRESAASPATPEEVVGDDAGDPLLRQLRVLGKGLPAEAFGQVLQQFLSSTGELIADLAGAVRAGETEAAMALAHKLKGGMATVGAVRLSSLAQRVQELGVAGETADLEGVLREIDSEYGRARTVVASLLGQIQTS